jgi:hypothetical protein
MTGRRLNELFAEVAEDVPAPALARTAWETARRARRRHRIAGAGAVAGVVAAALGVAGTLTAGGGPIAVPTGTPEASVPANPRPSPLSANVDGLPDRLRTATTDRLAPEVPDFDTVDVDGLSQHLGRTAVALYEKMPDEQATQPKDVYAWLDDGSWARLDQVRLRFGRDADGNQHSPLDTTSLSADGRYAAFAQPDEVVVVTIATGAVNRFPLPGYTSPAPIRRAAWTRPWPRWRNGFRGCSRVVPFEQLIKTTDRSNCRGEVRPQRSGGPLHP